MLKKLRRRLTIIFTALTGAILAAVLAVSLFYSIERLKSDNLLWFGNQVQSITQHVADAVVNGTSIDILEEEPFVITMYRNDEPVDIPVGWVPPTDRSELFAQTEDAAARYNLSIWADSIYMVRMEGNAESSFGGAVEANPAGESVDLYEFTMPNVMYSYDSYAVTQDRAAVVAAEQVAEAGSASDSEILALPGGDSVTVAETGVAAERESAGEAAPTQSTADEQAAGVAAPAESEVAVESVGATTAVLSPLYITSSAGQTANLDKIFNISTGGAAYRAAMVYLPLPGAVEETSDLYTIAIAEELTAQRQSIVWLWLGYGALLLVGLAGLALANWLLAKLVLKPTAEGIQRQADFVAAASHELRSPLAVVRSSLSAADAAPEERLAIKYRGNAEAEAERMSRLVDDLLLLAGGDAGSWKLQSEQVDLDTVLIEAAEQFAPLAKSRGIALKLELPDSTLAPVRGDKDRLRQIFSVLLDNALQYAPENSEIFLRAAQKKNKIEILVIDRGDGVSDADKPRIFERFFRADASRSDKSHFGLGLSVAKELAELHGGSLHVQDTPEGGATFRLVLPVK